MTAKILIIDKEFVPLQTLEKVCMMTKILIIDVEFVSPNTGESLYDVTDISN